MPDESGPKSPDRKPVTPQPATFDERFIEVFKNVAEMRSDIRHMDANISTLKTDISKLKVGMAESKGAPRSYMPDGRRDILRQMAVMEGRLHAQLNEQTLMAISVLAPVMVVSVGLTLYFVKTLA